ncbi:unnamed protein product [Orchesella dallaii]|uniref:F-box domain-containing protein n=1 Tax=Orchesella dallaii TaxID=48710 RepID=A0ABP1PMH2_9HEXA
MSNNLEPVVMEGLDGRSRWEELPAEVLEIILENVGSRNQLLSYRLVNSVWELAATSVLRRRCQDISTRWNSPLDLMELLELMASTSAPFPILTLVPKNSKRSGLSTAFYPRRCSPLRRGVNPFITNSLVLATTGMVDSGTFQNLAERKRLSIYNLLQRYGDCLTSLHIYGANVTQAELHKLLEQVPNLKAITLVKLRFGGVETEDQDPPPPVPVSPVPKLTHAILHVYSRTNCQWLVGMLGRNLISLDFVCLENILAFNESNYVDPTGSGLKPFQKLKRLKIIGPRRDFILLTGVNLKLSLESLCIEHLWNDALSIDELIQFLERFAGTLVDLHLNIGRLGGCGEMATILTQQRKRNPVTFPGLRRLIIDNVLGYGNFEWIKRYLLPRCPNLETLRLKGLEAHDIIYVRSTMTVLRGNAWDFLEKEGLWELFGNLKIIEVRMYSWVERKNLLYTFTRQERAAIKSKTQYMDSLIKHER